MTSRIVVFGATGYTGRLVAERLAAQGARPVLAGRDELRLGELAERLGGLETVKADALRRNSVFAAVEPGDVLVSTVGPFAKWGDAAVRAAIAAPGSVYLDST
ncbi:MAG TPA: NAD(P)H-binding protein, partial [Solirubrobacteraceae bacterium]|nr:NAD(P)H-binding protein [Solirubrobacteraceae bacterium]